MCKPGIASFAPFWESRLPQRSVFSVFDETVQNAHFCHLLTYCAFFTDPTNYTFVGFGVVEAFLAYQAVWAVSSARVRPISAFRYTFDCRLSLINTTTFAAIMTKRGHDQQQALHVCLLCSQGCLSVCLLCFIVEFVVFAVAI
jgi:hypothetical protein